MKVYVLAEEDLSALRSTWNPPRVYLSKQPGRTNMSGQIRETGWLGTTGHIYRLALGAVDTDMPNWNHKLRQLLPDDFQLDNAALLAWIEHAAPATPFHLNPVHVRCTEGLTWNEESDDEDWWPSARPGWTIIATYGPEGAQVQGLDPLEAREIGVQGAAEALATASVHHDYQVHLTDGQVDWAAIAVRYEDLDRALHAIQATLQ